MKISVKKTVVFLLLLSLVLQFTYMGLFNSPFDLTYGSDSEQYDRLAMNLGGKGFSLDRRPEVIIDETPYDAALEKPTAWRTPGYPLFLAGIYKITGRKTLEDYHVHHKIVYAIQILLTTLSFFLLFKLCKKSFGKKAALLLLAILVIWPPFITFSTQLMAEALALFLLTSICYLLLFNHGNYWRIALAGLMGGLLMLTKANFFLVVPILAFMMVQWMSSLSNGKKAKLITLFVILSLLVVSPWVIRNQNIMGTYAFSTQSGEALYFGTLPYDFRIYSQGAVSPTIRKSYYETRLLNLSEKEESRILQNQAWSNLKEHPLGVLKNKIQAMFYVGRVPYMWYQLHNQGGFMSIPSKVFAVGMFSYLFFWIAMCSFAIAFILFNIRRWELRPFAFLALYPLIAGFLTFITGRYVVVYAPFIFMLACGWLFDKNEKKIEERETTVGGVTV